MKKLFNYSIIILLFACNNQQEIKTKNNVMMDQNLNLLTSMSNENLNGFKWMNKPEDYQFKDGLLYVTTPGKSDFFNDPTSKSIVETAPFLYKEIKGDFVATALVEPDFSSVWNALSLFVYRDSLHWIKFAFENSDATGKSIVSVVTNNVSDDANGVILKNHGSVWLKMVRKGNIYSMHWSVDGENYRMARLAQLSSQDNILIGLEAQCPIGKSANHKVLFFSIKNKTVNDLREGE